MDVLTAIPEKLPSIAPVLFRQFNNGVLSAFPSGERFFIGAIKRVLYLVSAQNPRFVCLNSVGAAWIFAAAGRTISKSNFY